MEAIIEGLAQVINQPETTVQYNYTEEKQPAARPVIICGSCGAIEQYIDHHRTECPNCDDYIY